ncbi:DNA-directed RNA polymerase sigma-70 factor [Bacteroidales bacterium]|nr:DNA-directed RNA polymerase sigma-70 factor [Bacteroidales bacterium]
MEALKDFNLFQQVQRDDIKAFEALHKYYHPRMFAYAKRFVEDSEAVKDILQDLFVDFWSKRTQINIDVSLSAFLFKVLRNKCIDYLRNQVVKDNFVNISNLRLAELKYNYLEQEDPFPNIFVREINEIVDKAISELSPQTQQIFLMSRKQGLKSIEIAAKLNLSVRTIEKHLYQTLKILKIKLVDYMSCLIV